MNIKIKLSIQFTIIVFALLIIFSFLVYLLWETSQRTRFKNYLLRRAKNVSSIIFSQGDQDLILMRRLNEITLSWREEEIIVADSALNIIYSYGREYLTDEVLKARVNPNGPVYFSVGKKDNVCYRTEPEYGFFYIFISAYDQSRSDNLAKLKSIMGYSILISLFISVLTSYLFSKRAVRPLSEMNASIKRINSQRLGERLNEGNGKDEIGQLAKTLNVMLSDIDSAFKSQTEFVSNASHELRTPLSVMISESDYIINNVKDGKEAQKHIINFHNDLKILNAKTNSLLELANLKNGNPVSFSKIMVDEIIYDSVRKVKTKYPGRRLAPKVDYSENKLLIMGNAGLLEIAFTNLLDNACKFSSGEVFVTVLSTNEKIIVSITDNGIGIPQEELQSISQPFKRASNAKYISGFGIGLAIVTKIISLHEASFKIDSSENKGTSVILSFDKAG